MPKQPKINTKSYDENFQSLQVPFLSTIFNQLAEMEKANTQSFQ